MRRVILGIALILLLVSMLGSGAASAGDAPAPGDLNCNGSTDAIDSLAILRFDAGLNVQQTQPCPQIGSEEGGLVFGDTNCDGDVNTVDALFVLRADAGLIVLADCAVQDLIPDEIQGVEIVAESHPGAEFVDPGSSLDETLAAMNKSEEDITLVTGLPTDPGALDFEMGVQTIAGVDAAQMLADFAADLETATGGDIAFEQVSVAGKVATKATALNDPTIAAVYYYAFDDSLVFVQSPDFDVVEEVFASLPAATGELSASVERAVTTTGSERGISVSVITRPQHKVCAGYPPELYRVQVHYTHPVLKGAVPMPFYEASTTATKGTIDPFTFSGKTVYGFDYAPESWGDDTIVVTVEVTDRWMGERTKEIDVDVQLCLSGDWEDGSRTLRVIHSAGVAAEIISGTLRCGVQGQAFSGELDGNVLSGDDLLVCNPDGCENLPLTDERPFEGIVSDTADRITITWEAQQFETDPENPNQCNPTHTTQEVFDITRLTFTPPRP